MRIAVCDDEKEVRDMFAGRLHELYPDAAISLYQSGDELLLAEGQPDIVLLDIQMPGKNGMETARDFRRNHKEAVIIFVTALEDYVFQAFDVGAFHYLVKPFDEGKFVEVLANAAAESADRKRGKEADKRKSSRPCSYLSRAGTYWQTGKKLYMRRCMTAKWLSIQWTRI